MNLESALQYVGQMDKKKFLFIPIGKRLMKCLLVVHSYCYSCLIPVAKKPMLSRVY
jgi:hypothetical protein